MTWRDQAMCRDYDPDLFFPRFQRGGSNPQHRAELAEHIAKAKRVCAVCPVDSECLDYALQTQMTGHRDHNCVWGGLTYQERCHVAEATVT